ncbi:MAG: hypothetical protein ABJQ70_06225, partial [Roseobacter sp.]
TPVSPTAPCWASERIISLDPLGVDLGHFGALLFADTGALRRSIASAKAMLRWDQQKNRLFSQHFA